MANYLLALSREDGHEALGQAIDEVGAQFPDDHASSVLPGGWRLDWLARHATGDLMPEGQGLFTGVAYDDDAEGLYFGRSGWESRGARVWADDDMPGCHVIGSWRGDRLRVTTDLYRMMPLFTTSAAGLVLVSDSAALLLRLRRRLGLPCTPDATVIGAMRWPNAMSAQLMSTRTPVQEITYVAVGQRVEVDLTDPCARAEVVTRPMREVFAWDGQSYGDTIRHGASRIASIIHTVATLGPEAARLSLSGGKDSRICLAAALLSPVGRDSARFTCTNTLPQHQRDAEVVQQLSETFGFPLGSRFPAVPRSAEIWRVRDPMGLWSLDSALTYYPVKLQAYGLRAKGQFAIAGFGSELYKGNYGLRSVKTIADSIATRFPGMAEDFDATCSDYLTHVGIDPADPLSAEWHYLGMRNALHGGRFVPVSKLGIRPLQQRSLVGLSKLAAQDRPAEMSGPKDITEDLMATMGPALAAHPFDRPAKDRDPEWVTERLRVIGGALTSDDLSTYAVHGDPETVQDGPVPALSALGADGQEPGAITRERVQARFEVAAAAVGDSDFATDWAQIVDDARLELADPAVPVGQARGMAGRVLSLGELLR